MASKLTTWINQKLKEKGTTASEEKKKAKKYKSISAAKKGGSLYYTDKNGKVMIAAYAEDLDSVSKNRPKARPETVQRVGLGYGDMTVAEKKEVDAANKDIKKQEKEQYDAKLKEAMDGVGITNKTRIKQGIDPSGLANPRPKKKPVKKSSNAMNMGGMVQKKGYNKGGLKAAPNKGAASLPQGVRNKMGYMNAGGMAKKNVMSYNLGGMIKSQVNNLKRGK
tara:strand:+ start:848 stop:1513 length:666 start_codon:yes stop_codon:yes gene_type:complete